MLGPGGKTPLTHPPYPNPARAQIPVKFVAHNIEPPSQEAKTTLGELKDFYAQMYFMRRLEIAADVLYKGKFIRGFCHLYDGQEAIVAGMEAALDFNDSVVTSYRDHCTHLGRGGTPEEVMAELLGRVGGASKGKGGSMHMYRKETNFYGGNGIVGAQVPLGAGMAFAHKYDEDGGVNVNMYGDGAANQGQIFEAFNMAGLWDLPAIFVCENNHYAMGTAEWRGAKAPHYYRRGDYIPGIKGDGMDVISVKQMFEYAKKHAQTVGPIVLELDTYRYHGHSMSDPGSTYRTRDEVSGVREHRDPIERVKLWLQNYGVETADIKKMEKEAKAKVDASIKFAKESAYPPATDLWSNVYTDNSAGDKPMQLRGVEAGQWFEPKYVPYK
mmetsp:Transcript_52626/g.167317  ORF Transcript_52626/g.167317 Transcript_52626/m.167317 type:complete len:384 (+) Transcript_52626:345-1496(+)